MGINVFLSYSVPLFSRQVRFLAVMGEHLQQQGFEARTLGVTDLNGNAPLKVIRRVLLESNGLVTIAFRRTEILDGRFYESRGRSGRPAALPFHGQWTTSPYCHIEPVMADQLGLPVLILCEAGVVADGVLRPGALNSEVHSFDLGRPPTTFFRSVQWQTAARDWEHDVRSVVRAKGDPRSFYHR
jgi:hypothetical protein